LDPETRVPDSSVIQRYLRSLRGRWRWWSALREVAGQALLCGVLLCLLELFAPTWSRVAWWCAGAWLVASAVYGWIRGRALLGVADRELGLRDRLLTYLCLQRRAVPVDAPAFVAWLEDDLAHRLIDLPQERSRALWRRPVGRVRYLLPLLVLLLLLRQFAPLASLPSTSGPPLASGSGAGGSSGAGGTGDDRSEQPPESSEGPAPPPPPDLTPPQPESAEQPEEQNASVDPPNLDHVRVLDEFVIPHFVGDGETRRDLSRLAVVEQGEGGRSAAAGQTARDETKPRPPDPQDYEKAYEQAMRARHVPPEERDFVRTYFDVLREAKR